MPVTPRLSILVIVYDMPRQAMNTLYSLSAEYQDGVDVSDYEVVVVENRSGRCLDPDAVADLGPNFRYLCRDEIGVSPVPAIQEGLGRCHGEILGLIIDGARMLTPRALQFALLAFAMQRQALVTIPGYHLGDGDHKDHLSLGHSEALETQHLEELEWQRNGYRLFQYACWSSGNKNGYLQPMLESPALFCRRSDLDAIGGVPEGFDQPGGGSVNLYIYRMLALRESTRLFVLPGEGSFHQFHGGVTTSEIGERERVLKAFDERLESIYGGTFYATAREPQLLGPIGHFAQTFLDHSLERGQKRFARLAHQQKIFWNDEVFEYWTENEPSKQAELRSAKVRRWEEP